MPAKVDEHIYGLLVFTPVHMLLYGGYLILNKPFIQSANHEVTDGI